MTVPGYDPDDLDAALAALAEDHDIDDLLTPEERARWEAGEGLSDLLDDEDVERLLTRAE